MSPFSRIGTLFSVGAIATLLAGCGSTTALDFQLTVTEGITDRAALLDNMVALEVVIDAFDPDRPIYLDRQASEPQANPRLEDLDGDGALEFIGRYPVTIGGDALPSLRIQPGGLESVPLKIAIFAIDNVSNQRVAAGEVAPVSFIEGQVQELPLVINTIAAARPPQVTMTIPDGLVAINPRPFAQIGVMFSKRMAHPTLDTAIKLVEVVPGQPDRPVTGTPQRWDLRSPSLDPNRPTFFTLLLDTPLTIGNYRISVDTTATDDAGRALDQDLNMPGPQPFSVDFVIDGTNQQCGAACEAAWCTRSGNTCPPFMKCDVRPFCEPDACGWACIGATRCDPSLGVCVSDCAAAGGALAGCFDITPICTAEGLCVAQ